MAQPTLATVRLEVRVGNAPPAAYEVGDGGFLVGAVPGCDLRLPGAHLAPVLCLIARRPDGASLRALAPMFPVAVNARPVSAAELRDGDAVTVGPAVLRVAVSPAPAAAVAPADLLARARLVEERERQLREQTEQLETDRVLWYRRREEVEAEVRRHKDAVEEVTRRARQVERDQAARAAELEAREQASGGLEELARVKKELGERYRRRLDRLAAQRQGVRRAARKLQQRKREADAQAAELAARREEWALRQAEVEAEREQLGRERGLLDEQHALFAGRQQELQRDLAARIGDIQERENRLNEGRAKLESGQKQHQGDLVRLDRLQGAAEERQRRLEARALEVDRGFERLQRETRELEEQARQLDEWDRRLAGEAEKLEARRKEQEALAGRAAALEGQQAMLATLRTRLERMREEVRREEQALSDQRDRHEAAEAELKARREESARLRAELDNDRQLFAEERKRYEESRATLDTAVGQLRRAQETLAAEEAAFKERHEAADATAVEQAEQAGLLLARASQLEQLRQALDAEKEALSQREQALAQAEQTLGSLQEQVRRRSEELVERQRLLDEREQQLAEEAQRRQEQAAEAEGQRREAETRLEALRNDLATREATLAGRDVELGAREEALRSERGACDEAQQALAADRVAWEVQRQTAAEAAERERGEFEAARAEAQALLDRLPEVEGRAQGALERVARAREQLREQLAEAHGYARESREELEEARRQLRQQELALHGARDEHRLAVAAFRQQLLEWQGQVGEMKQALAQGESRLGRREAEVEERARELAGASARLAERAEQLQRQQLQVAERRGEVERHLEDMREWYRHKLRELAGVDGADAPPAAEGAVLALGGEHAPADRQLGELLHAGGLVDAATLAALLGEARRQRRSLRQLLLAGGYLTLYQIALIEAGNLDGLVLGPVRVVDRLQATPREAVYRVFDPRANAEGVLRHLGEAEMLDAVRPDEFRQRFAAAAGVRHPNVAAVLEVLEVAGRPAALLEWVRGVPSGDWTPLAAAPGAWFRLLNQAALALHTAHAAGLAHGHLQPGSFVLTEEGLLKLCGLGEPRWLAGLPPADEPEGPAADLAALGRVAAGWAEPAGAGKGAKVKPLPPELLGVLRRLRGEGAPYESAAALLEDLDAAGAKVPASAAAWERLLREVREQSAPAGLRRSA